MNRVCKIFLILLLVNLILSCNSKNTDNNQQVEEKIPYSKAKKMHEKELLEWNKNIVELDAELIRKYIQRRNWNMEVTASGLYYQIYQKTNDIKAENGLVAVFNYKTSLLNGTVLYSSDEFGKRSILLGKNNEETGLNEGILLMRKGEKARFILPPHLAFGVPGDGFRVPYNSILVYEIELIDLVKPENNQQANDEDNIRDWI